MCRTVIDLLVDLPAADLATTGLGAAGKGDACVGRQVEGWSERYGKARTGNVGVFEPVTRWLADHQPADLPHALVAQRLPLRQRHAPRDDPTRPASLLDGGLATADDLMDLANCLGYWIQADDGRRMQAFQRKRTHLPAMMSWEEVVRYYCSRTGTRATNREGPGTSVFGLFRSAVIAKVGSQL